MVLPYHLSQQKKSSLGLSVRSFQKTSINESAETMGGGGGGVVEVTGIIEPEAGRKGNYTTPPPQTQTLEGLP